jgi:hypothetical protein
MDTLKYIHRHYNLETDHSFNNYLPPIAAEFE